MLSSEPCGWFTDLATILFQRALPGKALKLVSPNWP